MRDIIYNLSNGVATPLDKIYEFIKFVWVKDNPGKEYDEKVTIKTFNLGYGQDLLNTQFNKVMAEPIKYGFNITKLLNKGQILKVYVENC